MSEKKSYLNYCEGQYPPDDEELYRFDKYNLFPLIDELETVEDIKNLLTFLVERDLLIKP